MDIFDSDLLLWVAKNVGSAAEIVQAGIDGLAQPLRKAGVKTVVLGGITTTIGVETTARNAAGLGFAVVLVEDACTDRDAAMHHASFEKIFPRLGRVRKSAEVIAALG